MRFSRISITKKDVSLSWTTSDAGAKHDHEFESKDKPLASFAGALQAFSGYALSLIGAPKEWDERMRVTTLNLHEDKNGRRGLQVSFNHPVDKARGSAVSITTPTLWEADNPDAEIADGFYGTQVLEMIELAESEALRFQKGEREKQEEIFEKPDGDDLAPRRGRKGKGKDAPVVDERQTALV